MCDKHQPENAAEEVRQRQSAGKCRETEAEQEPARSLKETAEEQPRNDPDKAEKPKALADVSANQ